MYGLLDEATVLHGDGNWTQSYNFDALSCGRSMSTADVCTPPANATPSDSKTTYRVDPWVIYGYQKFGVRCEPAEAEKALQDAITDATEYFVAENFWNGDVANWVGATSTGDGLYLMHTDVTTVSAAADQSLSVSKALKKAYDDSPYLQPVLHLGLDSAAAIGKLDNFTTIERLGIPTVISPGYPAAGIAVTGPITVRLGSLEGLDSHDWTHNRHYFDGTRIVAVEFDPCLAVRVT